jgi:hypothetical protein
VESKTAAADQPEDFAHPHLARIDHLQGTPRFAATGMNGKTTALSNGRYSSSNGQLMNTWRL